MLDKKQVGLINQEIDGANTEKEKASLRRLLEKSQEARQLLEELNGLKAFFSEIKPVDPPSHLKQHIMNSLPRRTTARQPFRRGSFLDALLSNTRYRYAYTFAGGAAVGILLFAFLVGFPNESSDLSDVYGTMASNERATRYESELTSPISLAEVRGSIITKYSPYLVISEFTLQSDRDVDVVVTFDRSKLKFDGFRQTSPSQGYVGILDGELKWTNKGQNTYNIIFVNESKGAPSITARLFASGKLLYETTIVPTEKK